MNYVNMIKKIKDQELDQGRKFLLGSGTIKLKRSPLEK